MSDARRHLLYLVFDATAGMAGRPAEVAVRSIRDLLQEIQGDPFCLEATHIALVACGERVEEVRPLTELCSFSGVAATFGTHRRFGGTLPFVWERVKRDFRRWVSRDDRGDWSAVVLVYTAGDWDDPDRVLADQATLLGELARAGHRVGHWAWAYCGDALPGPWFDRAQAAADAAPRPPRDDHPYPWDCGRRWNPWDRAAVVVLPPAEFVTGLRRFWTITS